jgi:hypothetical protein
MFPHGRSLRDEERDTGIANNDITKTYITFTAPTYANSSNCYATQGMKEHEIFNSLHSITFPFIMNAVKVNSDLQPRNVQYFILFKEKFHSFAENTSFTGSQKTRRIRPPYGA